jgi:hypothetical protein
MLTDRRRRFPADCHFQHPPGRRLPNRNVQTTFNGPAGTTPTTTGSASSSLNDTDRVKAAAGLGPAPDEEPAKMSERLKRFAVTPADRERIIPGQPAPADATATTSAEGAAAAAGVAQTA